VKNIVVTTAVVAVACSILSYAQSAKQAAPPYPQAASAPDAANQVPRDGLSDLDAITFACPKAALNAAAREAKKVPSKGTYQFSYFKIINYSHHSSYEIHFKSNYQGEADLKYRVAMYCQQGWDPRTTKTSVRLMGSGQQSEAGAAHGADCGDKQTPVKRRLKR
jgi:hypothetical protein